MYPVLFEIGGFSFATYGLMVALGAIAAVQVGKREIVDRDKLLDEDTFWNHLYLVLILAFAGAKGLFILKFWDRFDTWGDILGSIRFGFVFYGGFLAAFGFFYFFYRRQGRPFWTIVDRAVPSVALAHGIGRIGCFLAGCCHGVACDLPWAVAFSHPESLVAPELLGVPLHPAQLYDAFGNLLLAGTLSLWALPRARRFTEGFWSPGVVSGLYVFGYFLLRFQVEFVRGDDRGGFVSGGLTSYQWISVAGIAFSLLVLARPGWRGKMSPENPQAFNVQDGDIRLDAYLAEVCEDFSRSFLQSLIRRGCVRVNGESAEPRKRLNAGDKVEIEWPESAQSDWDFEAAIVHEDRHFLVVNKPSGLLVHPMGENWQKSLRALKAAPEASLVGYLAERRPEAAGSGVERCGLVHRLDRGTSGLIAVAKTPDAQDILLQAWKDREVSKTYRAFVYGKVHPAKGVVEIPIHRFTGARRLAAAPWGREARTEYKVRAGRGDYSDIEAKPVTGRTHQIRIHLAEIGHPVLGDPEYAKKGAKGPVVPRLMLHAWKLAFGHPSSGKEMSFTARVPSSMTSFWRSLG